MNLEEARKEIHKEITKQDKELGDNITAKEIKQVIATLSCIGAFANRIDLPSEEIGNSLAQLTFIYMVLKEAEIRESNQGRPKL